MNWLDENFPDDQREHLVRSRIPHRRVGFDVGWLGMQDIDILPLLHATRGVTFFTLDEDFFKRRLCHRAYCLVWIDTLADDAAEYLVRLHRHPRFRTQSQRMGTVIRVFHDGLACWTPGATALARFEWPEA